MENREFELLARRYMDMVFRLAFSYMKSASDADDVTQNVLLRLLRSTKPFESEEHARFWLVRVTNELHFETQEHSDLFYAVMELPEKYRTAIYLYYYEDYYTDEIARLTGTPAATVRTRLRRGRELLRAGLEEAKSDV